MRYFENPNDGNKVYCYDSQDSTQESLIRAACDGGWKELTGNWPPAPSLVQVKTEQIALINAKCQESLSAIVLPYPPDETLTWHNQYAEAQAFTANQSAQTPMLSAIAAASGQTVVTLAQTVLAKAAAYNAAAGASVGKRQALTAQIMAVKATDANPVDAVRSIVW